MTHPRIPVPACLLGFHSFIPFTSLGYCVTTALVPFLFLSIAYGIITLYIRPSYAHGPQQTDTPLLFRCISPSSFPCSARFAGLWQQPNTNTGPLHAFSVVPLTKDVLVLVQCT